MSIQYGNSNQPAFQYWAPSAYVPVIFPMPAIWYPPLWSGKRFVFGPQLPPTYSAHSWMEPF